MKRNLVKKLMAVVLVGCLTLSMAPVAMAETYDAEAEEDVSEEYAEEWEYYYPAEICSIVPGAEYWFGSTVSGHLNTEDEDRWEDIEITSMTSDNPELVEVNQNENGDWWMYVPVDEEVTEDTSVTVTLEHNDMTDETQSIQYEITVVVGQLSFRIEDVFSWEGRYEMLPGSSLTLEPMIYVDFADYYTDWDNMSEEEQDQRLEEVLAEELEYEWTVADEEIDGITLEPGGTGADGYCTVTAEADMEDVDVPIRLTVSKDGQVKSVYDATVYVRNEFYWLSLGETDSSNELAVGESITVTPQLYWFNSKISDDYPDGKEVKTYYLDCYNDNPDCLDIKQDGNTFEITKTGPDWAQCCITAYGNEKMTDDECLCETWIWFDETESGLFVDSSNLMDEGYQWIYDNQEEQIINLVPVGLGNADYTIDYRFGSYIEEADDFEWLEIEDIEKYLSAEENEDGSVKVTLNPAALFEDFGDVIEENSGLQFAAIPSNNEREYNWENVWLEAHYSEDDLWCEENIAILPTQTYTPQVWHYVNDADHVGGEDLDDYTITDVTITGQYYYGDEGILDPKPADEDLISLDKDSYEITAVAKDGCGFAVLEITVERENGEKQVLEQTIGISNDIWELESESDFVMEAGSSSEVSLVHYQWDGENEEIIVVDPTNDGASYSWYLETGDDEEYEEYLNSQVSIEPSEEDPSTAIITVAEDADVHDFEVGLEYRGGDFAEDEDSWWFGCGITVHYWGEAQQVNRSDESVLIYTCEACGEEKEVANSDYTTVGKAVDGKWYYYVNGVVQTSYTGFASNENGDWYIEKGKVTFAKNSVIKDAKGAIGPKGTWYYVVGSKVRKDYTGVANYKNENGWWYIRNGKVDFTYTGFSSNKNGKWYVEKGQVKFNKNSVIKDAKGAIGPKGTWYYVVGSKVQTGYTGVANYKNENGWWYIKNGKVDFSANTVAKNKNGWWYVKNGKVDFKYTGIASNKNGTWYVKDGKVRFDYSGKVKVGKVTYTVIKGKVKK